MEHSFSLLAAITKITEKGIFFFFPWKTLLKKQIHLQTSTLSTQTTLTPKIWVKQIETS